jgi:hypothetical protein
MAEVDRWVIISLADETRQEFDPERGMREVVIPAGTVVNICLWDGETQWVPPEGTRVMRESEYLAKENTDA